MPYSGPAMGFFSRISPRGCAPRVRGITKTCVLLLAKPPRTKLAEGSRSVSWGSGPSSSLRHGPRTRQVQGVEWVQGRVGLAASILAGQLVLAFQGPLLWLPFPPFSMHGLEPVVGGAEPWLGFGSGMPQACPIPDLRGPLALGLHH